MTKDEMVEWHHQLIGHEFEQTPGVSKGQGKPGVKQRQHILKVTGSYGGEMEKKRKGTLTEL